MNKKSRPGGAPRKEKQAVVRFQMEVLKQQDEQLESLMQKAGLRKKKEAFDYALSFFSWMVEEAALGNKIGSLVEGGLFKELVAPPLQNASSYGKKKPDQNGSNATSGGTDHKDQTHQSPYLTQSVAGLIEGSAGESKGKHT